MSGSKILDIENALYDLDSISSILFNLSETMERDESEVNYRSLFFLAQQVNIVRDKLDRIGNLGIFTGQAPEERAIAVN